VTAGHALIGHLRGYGFDLAHYVIFGSGPLLAHGLRTDLGDLDIVARGPVWDRVTALGAVRPAPSGHGSVVFLAGGALEIADRWLPGWDTDDLIGEAQIIDALPFAPLSAVRTSKRCTGRAKDLRDLDLIEAHDTPHTRRCCPACRAPTRFATAA
jgi:hypothetical protein